jgi:hypothetical protein
MPRKSKNSVAVPDKYERIHGVSEEPIKPFIPVPDRLNDLFVERAVHTKGVQGTTRAHFIIYHSFEMPSM